MPSDPSAVAGARAQLLQVATSAQTWDAPLRTLPRGAAARPAAVLILFGVLDALPSAHEAQDAAVSRDLDVLLLARATTLRAHPGQVAFPGGRLDPGDDGPVAAALREANEETGLDPAGDLLLLERTTPAGGTGPVSQEYHLRGTGLVARTVEAPATDAAGAGTGELLLVAHTGP